MRDASLLSTLRDLERNLHRSDVRSDPERLGALLHCDFYEVGASGKIYSRDEVLVEFRDAPPPYEVWAQDFECHEVVEGGALLQYRSAHIGAGSSLSRHVARTSLWQCNQGRWQLRYHHGTPTDPFEKHAT